MTQFVGILKPILPCIENPGQQPKRGVEGQTGLGAESGARTFMKIEVADSRIVNWRDQALHDGLFREKGGVGRGFYNAREGAPPGRVKNRGASEECSRFQASA